MSTGTRTASVFSTVRTRMPSGVSRKAFMASRPLLAPVRLDHPHPGGGDGGVCCSFRGLQLRAVRIEPAAFGHDGAGARDRVGEVVVGDGGRGGGGGGGA